MPYPTKRFTYLDMLITLHDLLDPCKRQLLLLPKRVHQCFDFLFATAFGNMCSYIINLFSHYVEFSINSITAINEILVILPNTRYATAHSEALHYFLICVNF